MVLMEEILHQLIGTLSVYVQVFIHPRWCRISSINSSVREWWKGESEESPPKRLGGILGCIIYHSQVRWRWLNPYSCVFEVFCKSQKKSGTPSLKFAFFQKLHTLGDCWLELSHQKIRSNQKLLWKAPLWIIIIYIYLGCHLCCQLVLMRCNDYGMSRVYRHLI